MPDMRILARPGDLLFYRASPKSSLLRRIIAAVSLLRSEGNSPIQYYHVSIVAPDLLQQYEARWPRIRVSEINWNDPGLELWRVADLDILQHRQIADKARTMVGQWYDLGKLLFAFMDLPYAEICTTMVQKSVAVVGKNVGSYAGRFITPNELRMDPLLRFVAQNTTQDA